MALAVLGFLVGVAYWPGIMSAAVAPRWWLIGLGGALLLWRVRVEATLGHALGAAFLLWCGLTYLWSVSPNDTLGELVKLLALGAVFCVAAQARDLRRFYLALGLAVLVNLPISVAQAYFEVALWRSHVTGAFNETAGGFFHNKNMLAEFAMLALIPALFARDWWLVLPLALVLLVTQSVGVGLALVLVAVVQVALWARREAGYLGAALVLLAGVLLIGTLVWLDLFVLRPSRIEGYDSRLVMWQIAWANSGLLGWGLGSFAPLLPQFEWAHNEYLHLLFELGAPSLLIWALLFGAVGVADEPERSILLALLAAAAVSYPFHMPATAFVAAVVAGRVWGAHARLVELQPARRAPAAGGLCRGSGPSARSNLSGLGRGGVDVSARSQHP